MAQTPAEFVDQRDAVDPPRGREPRASIRSELLAQAALETGWGQRMPRTADGSPSLNLFGIKAGEDWTGRGRRADTVEFSERRRDAAPHRVSRLRLHRGKRQRLRKSAEEFAALSARRLAAGADAQAYIAGIGQSGYATDPEYANKLNQILNSGTLQAALLPRTAAL